MQNTNVNYMRAFETGLKELPPGERIQRSGWKLKGGRTAEGIVRVNRGRKEIRKKRKKKKSIICQRGRLAAQSKRSGPRLEQKWSDFYSH